MNTKENFILACKIFGVYCLLASVPLFVSAVGTFFMGGGVDPEMNGAIFFTKVISRLMPFIYLFFGIYLIRNSEKIFNFAYQKSGDDEKISIPPDKYRFALKVFGMYLLIKNLPELIESTAKFLIHSNAPDLWNLFSQQQYTMVQFVPSLFAVIFGLYLVKSGEFFVSLGFRESPEKRIA